MRFRLLFILFLTVTFGMASAQDTVVKLWKGVDGQYRGHQRRPELRVYYPNDSLRNGTCVIICPGGSYHHLGLINEGSEVAEWFQSHGITAFVLRYRVSMYGNHHPAMIEDMQRSIQLVRENAFLFRIDPSRLGVIGFSAGGHLVTMAGAFHSHNYLVAKGVDVKVSLRPDFVVAVYPVVSMQDSIAHKRSRKNLLTRHYTIVQKNQFSMEQQIPGDMPPMFLLACKDDPVVDYRNSTVLYAALQRQGIPTKFILFDKGGHGFGMIRTQSEESYQWNRLLLEWMKKNNFVN